MQVLGETLVGRNLVISSALVDPDKHLETSSRAISWSLDSLAENYAWRYTS